jgi:RHS repeat-associated protein
VTAPGQTTISGGEYLAQTPEHYTYDLDGDQLSDGRFNYTWDAESRLISAISLASAPAASMSSNIYTYDYMGRRIQKAVWTNSGSAWVVAYTNKFVYDGWNVAAILDGSNNVLYTFTWGKDLSGSMQGAGGVGGLLSMTICTGVNAGTYFPCYDGNGNVVAMVNAATGAVAVNFEYGPFGELIRATGPLAKLCPFMFSTKFYDWETGLYYYGYRYYNPSTGRWPSRDPAEEMGGPNLYGFADNDGVNAVDLFGLAIECNCPDKYFEDNGIHAGMYKLDGGAYKAVSGVQGPASGAGLILWRMLQTSHTFTAQNLSVDQLAENVKARITIVNNAIAAKFSWEDKRGKILHPTSHIKEIDANANNFFWLHPDQFFDAVNNAGTFLRCDVATTYVFESGNLNKGIGGRDNDEIFVPGDWAYLRNKAAADNPQDWAIGLEGENLIYLDSTRFWGHPAGIMTEQEWRDDIAHQKPGSEWLSNTGKPGIPVWGRRDLLPGKPLIQYPKRGLQ